MMNFNNKMLKSTNSDNEEESIEKLNKEKKITNTNKKNTEQKPVYKLDFKEMNYQGEIVKKSTAKNEKTKDTLKIDQWKDLFKKVKNFMVQENGKFSLAKIKEKEIIQENKQKVEDDPNQLEIIEVKSNIVQYKKEDITNNKKEIYRR